MVIEIGTFLLLHWAWEKWRGPRPPSPPGVFDQPVWVFDYKGERNAPMQFLVYAATESAALIKYLKAGLDPKRITGSYPHPQTPSK